MKDLCEKKDNLELKKHVNTLSCLVLGGTEYKPEEWEKIIPQDLRGRSKEVKQGKKVQKPKVKEYAGNQVCDLVRFIRNKVSLINTLFVG